MCELCGFLQTVTYVTNSLESKATKIDLIYRSNYFVGKIFISYSRGQKAYHKLVLLKNPKVTFQNYGMYFVIAVWSICGSHSLSYLVQGQLQQQQVDILISKNQALQILASYTLNIVYIKQHNLNYLK